MAINHLANSTTYAIHMRCPSNSGGKDWVGSVTSGGELHTFWGKIGAVNQHAGKMGDMNSLQKIIGEKLSKGYTQVDEYDSRHGNWESQRQKQATASFGSAMKQAAENKPPKPTGPPITILKAAPPVSPQQSTQPAVVPLEWDF